MQTPSSETCADHANQQIPPPPGEHLQITQIPPGEIICASDHPDLLILNPIFWRNTQIMQIPPTETCTYVFQMCTYF